MMYDVSICRDQHELAKKKSKEGKRLETQARACNRKAAEAIFAYNNAGGCDSPHEAQVLADLLSRSHLLSHNAKLSHTLAKHTQTHTGRPANKIDLHDLRVEEVRLSPSLCLINVREGEGV